MKSKSHKKIERPLADPLYKSVLAEYERTGVWPKLRRSGKLPAEVMKAKKEIEEKIKERNTSRLSQFFKKQDAATSSTVPTLKAATGSHEGTTKDLGSPADPSPKAQPSPSIPSEALVLSSQDTSVSVGVQVAIELSKADSVQFKRPCRSLADVPAFQTLKWIRSKVWLEELERPLPDPSKIFCKDLLVWNPDGGRCISCGSANLLHTSKLSNEKLIYNFNWPYVAQTTRVACSSCNRTFYKWDPEYLITLPLKVQLMAPFLYGGKGLDYEVIHHARRALMGGGNLSQVVGVLRASLCRGYESRRRAFLEKWEKDMNNPFIRNKPESTPLPPDNIWLPSYEFLLAMMLRDLLLEKQYLARELAGVLGTEGGTIGIDCQRKVARKVTETHVCGQTCTVVSDFGLVLSCGLVPSTATRYAVPMVTEVFNRYKNAGAAPPSVFFTDCNCCSESGGSNWAPYIPSSTTVKLDVFHVITRLLRASNQAHSLSNRLAKDLGKAFLAQDASDAQALERARLSLGIKGPVSKADRLKHVRRYVPEKAELKQRVENVIQSYYQSDLLSLEEWEKEKKHSKQVEDSESTTNERPPLGSRYQPLLGEAFFSVYHNQVVHIERNCLSDIGPCMAQVDMIGYRGSSIMLPVYRANRGTSRVESFHSVMQRSFGSFSRVGSCLFDLKLWWTIHKINRRVRIKCGQKVPAEDLSPREAASLQDLDSIYPDFRMVPESYEDLPKIGYEYLRGLDKDLSGGVDLGENWNEDPLGAVQKLEDHTEACTLGSDSEDAQSSDSCSSSDSESIAESQLGQNTPIPKAATKPRKFNRLRGMSQTSPLYRVDHEARGDMERAFIRLHLTHPKANAVELYRLYTEQCLMKERVAHIEEMRKPLCFHPTSIHYVEEWLSKYRKEASFARESGSSNSASMQIFQQLDNSLIPKDAVASSDGAHLLIASDGMVEGPREVTAEDVERDAYKLQKGDISSRQVPKSQPGSPPEPQETQRDGKKLRRCRFCRLPLRKGLNRHEPDGSPFGRCPLRDKVECDMESRKNDHARAEMDKKVAKTLEEAVLLEPAESSSKKGGLKCYKCKRQYAVSIERNGLIWDHHQFRQQKNEGGYSQVLWCPLVDAPEELEKLQEEQAERRRARWKEENDRRRTKKLKRRG